MSRQNVARGVCMVINVCLSHRCDTEVLKNGPLSLTKALTVFSCTFFSLTCHGEKHIMRCCCPCGYKLSMWQGCVQVCLSVPCSFEECPQSARSSRTPSKPESKYQPSNDTERPQLRADTYVQYVHLAFTSTYLFCHLPKLLERKENYTLLAKMLLRHTKFNIVCCASNLWSVSLVSRGQMNLLTFHVPKL